MYLSNNLDAGPHGTTVTVANSNDNGGDAFDSVDSAGATTVLAYSSTPARATAEYVMKTSVGATAAMPHVTWSTSAGTQSQVYLRLYAQLGTMTASNAPLFMSMLNGSICASIEIAGTATPKMWVAGLSSFSAGTVTIPIGVWFRVEARFAFGNTTTPGTADARFYLDADSDVISETLTFPSFDSRNTTANQFHFGPSQALANYPITYHSGVALSTDGWIGPAPRRLGTGAPAGNLSTPTAVHDSLG